MIEFKKELLTDEGLAVHCTHRWQAVELLNWAGSNGKTWNSEKPYYDNGYNTNFDEHGKLTWYDIAAGTYGKVGGLGAEDYKLISYEDALVTNDTQSTDVELEGRVKELERKIQEFYNSYNSLGCTKEEMLEMYRDYFLVTEEITKTVVKGVK